jgi:hypothetical protein
MTPLSRETMTKAERRLLRSMLGRPYTPGPRRDSVTIGWLLVAASLGIAAGLGRVA